MGMRLEEHRNNPSYVLQRPSRLTKTASVPNAGHGVDYVLNKRQVNYGITQDLF